MAVAVVLMKQELLELEEEVLELQVHQAELLVHLMAELEATTQVVVVELLTIIFLTQAAQAVQE